MYIVRVFVFATLCSIYALDPAHAFGFKDPFDTQSDLPVTAPARCADEAVPDKLTLIQAVDIALCRNPDTRAAWSTAQSAAAGFGDSKSAYLPTVGLDYAGTRNWAYGGTGATLSGTRGTGIENTYGPSLSLSYLIYDFGGREASVESARQAMLEAGWTASSIMQALVFQVIKGYTDVFSASESLEAANQAEAASKESFEAAKAREEAGVVTPADTAQAETAYAQSVLFREQAENTLQLARGNFARLLHLNPDTSLALAPVEPDPANNPFQQNVSDLIKQALERRPDLSAARAREERANADWKRARRLDYPTIGVTGSTGSTDTSRTGISTRDQSSLTLRLSIPLFTGFSNTYQQQGARYAAEAATANREKSIDDAAFDVWTAYHNFQTAQRTYVTAQSLLKSAKASEELTLGRYKVGNGTLIDLLDAQARNADARRQWVSSRYNLLVTRFDLARAMGDPKLAQLKPQEEPTLAPLAPVEAPQPEPAQTPNG